MMTWTKMTWGETIRCPKCDKEQVATVEHHAGDPFPAYVHKCSCGYIITESDWEKVKD
jgi:hypothetical protein